MKKRIYFLGALICIMTASCSLVTNYRFLLKSSTSSSNTHPSSSKSVNSKRPSSSMTSQLGPNDFPTPRDSYSRYSPIFCWRDEAGDFYCGVRPNSSSSFLQWDFLVSLQTENPCPINVMRKIISEYRTKYPEEKINNSLYEISYPMDDIAYYDAVSVHRGISSKNPLIYSLLGLDELYESLYANDTSLFFDAYYDEFKNETNEAVMAHARYFNNLSHIYRWINEDGVARYAVGPQRNKQEVTTLERVARAQESFSCSEEEMKRVIEAYYRTTSYTDVMSENLIIDVPILNDQNYPIWYEINKNLDDYTNDNRALYEKFGILTGYRIKFGA